MEAIILAGGLGTRLRSEVADIPKSMALIQSKPFMVYCLDQLLSSGTTKVIFSVGYKSEHIQNYFGDNYRGCRIVYAKEETLLGTGGAIKNAMQFVDGDNVIVVNGDSMFLTDLHKQLELHQSSNADVTLALKPMKNFERYGSILLSDEGRIFQFLEKQAIKEGLINTGTYIFNVKSFTSISFPEKFSIERDFFEAKVDQFVMMGHVSNGYFLDIGIPSDFRKAQTEIGIFQEIDTNWTLFLDRDGVINTKRDNDYVKSLDELELLPNVLDAIKSCTQFFGRIIVVTNQQGIGKGLMTEDSLHTIHSAIGELVVEAGGKIDQFYHAPQLVSENSSMRKPNIGMALAAQNDYPEIDFSKSILLGDSLSDMEFGKNAGMSTVFISEAKNNDYYTLNSLVQFADLLESILHYSKSK